MSKTRKIAFGAPAIAVLFAAGTMVSMQLTAGESAPWTPPKEEAILAEGNAQTMELLRLMDTDKSGKVSRQEFMRFMEAEFDSLDKDKSGELDVRELTRSQLQVKPYSFTLAGK